jgi:hypothetical protein
MIHPWGKSNLLGVVAATSSQSTQGPKHSRIEPIFRLVESVDGLATSCGE